jgi:hypothetical protein
VKKSKLQDSVKNLMLAGLKRPERNHEQNLTWEEKGGVCGICVVCVMSTLVYINILIERSGGDIIYTHKASCQLLPKRFSFLFLTHIPFLILDLDCCKLASLSIYLSIYLYLYLYLYETRDEISPRATIQIFLDSVCSSLDVVSVCMCVFVCVW